MDMNYVIISDTALDVQMLEKLLLKTTELMGCTCKTYSCLCLKDIPDFSFLSGLRHALVFIEASLPALRGIELIDFMRNKNSRALFVLMSSQAYDAVSGYKADAFDFILKPFTEDDVFSVLQHAVKKFQSSQTGSLCFYTNKTSYRINYTDIVMITVEKNYAKLATPYGNYTFRATVRKLKQDLPEQFLLVSRNTIFPMDFSFIRIG